MSEDELIEQWVRELQDGADLWPSDAEIRHVLRLAYRAGAESARPKEKRGSAYEQLEERHWSEP